MPAKPRILYRADASHAMGFGHVAPLPLEAMLVDGVDDVPGPALGCEGSPSEANGIFDAGGTTSATVEDAAAHTRTVTTEGSSGTLLLAYYVQVD